MLRQLLAVMKPNVLQATPQMRQALKQAYAVCKKSVESSVGTVNSWSRRWTPFIQRYGPATDGFRADSMEADSFYDQFLRMLLEYQALKAKHGFQTYQLVLSARTPHPVRYVSPLRPERMRLIDDALDADEIDTSYRRISQWPQRRAWQHFMDPREGAE